MLVADTAAAALPMLKGDDAPDVLLTDVVLGTGMNGIDLAEAARVFKPGLPVIFMSGFTAVPEAQTADQRKRRAVTDEAVDALAARAGAERRYARQPPRYFDVLSKSASG